MKFLRNSENPFDQERLADILTIYQAQPHSSLIYAAVSNDECKRAEWSHWGNGTWVAILLARRAGGWCAKDWLISQSRDHIEESVAEHLGLCSS